MRLFDAHCHIDGVSKKEADIALCCASHPKEWPLLLEIASKNKNIVPCFGLHPFYIGKEKTDWFNELGKNLQQSRSCIGEIGLDANVLEGSQEIIFYKQLELAQKLGRPAIIHCVGCFGKMLEILSQIRLNYFLLHSYSGSAEMVSAFVKAGAYFSFGSAIYNERRKKMRSALAAIPSDRLLFETENAGNKSLADIISMAAKIIKMPANKLADISFENGLRFISGL